MFDRLGAEHVSNPAPPLIPLRWTASPAAGVRAEGAISRAATRTGPISGRRDRRTRPILPGPFRSGKRGRPDRRSDTLFRVGARGGTVSDVQDLYRKANDQFGKKVESIAD